MDYQSIKLQFLIWYDEIEAIVYGSSDRVERNEHANKDFITWNNEQYPKSKKSREFIENLSEETCVYWHDLDITIDEAKEQLEIVDEEHSNLFHLSPLDQVMKIFSESKFISE